VENYGWDIKIYNITGQEIEIERIDKEYTVEINTSDLFPGIYFLILSSSNSKNRLTYNLKFVK